MSNSRVWGVLMGVNSEVSVPDLKGPVGMNPGWPIQKTPRVIGESKLLSDLVECLKFFNIIMKSFKS